VTLAEKFAAYPTAGFVFGLTVIGPVLQWVVN